MLLLGKKYLEKENIKNVKLIKGDLKNLVNIVKEKHIIPRYFTCISTLHQIKNPLKLLYDCTKILNKGGRIFVQDIIRNSPWPQKRERLLHLLEINPGLFIARFKGHLSALTDNEIECMLLKLKSNGYVKKYEIFNITRKGYKDLTIGFILEK